MLTLGPTFNAPGGKGSGVYYIIAHAAMTRMELELLAITKSTNPKIQIPTCW
ncbi:hypothetical protein V8C43DRAFT_279325 [Trichoderma afarasin]